MSEVYIFGAGNVGKYILPTVQQRHKVLAFLDNDKTKWGTSHEGIPICDPESVLKSDETKYDMVVVASLAGIKLIIEQLTDMGVEREKISSEYVDYHVKSRIVFLENLATMFREQGISGCIAECGVFQGEFAQELNKAFPKEKLYLFDTFAGFDERDATFERKEGYSTAEAGHFNITSEEIVLKNLPHPEMCVIRKGYFPETTEGLNEKFCLVNLDFDLYQPTVAGLEYFYPRMVKGGVILIHDYFSIGWQGVKKAVDEFVAKNDGVRFFPIGDGLSVAVFH